MTNCVWSYPSSIFKMWWGWNTKDSNFFYWREERKGILLSGSTFQPNVFIFGLFYFFPLIFILSKIKDHWRHDLSQQCWLGKCISPVFSFLPICFFFFPLFQCNNISILYKMKRKRNAAAFTDESSCVRVLPTSTCCHQYAGKCNNYLL